MIIVDYLKSKLPPDGPKVTKELFLFFLIITAIIFWSDMFWDYRNKAENNVKKEETVATSTEKNAYKDDEEEKKDDCTVMGIKLRGSLVTYISSEQKNLFDHNQSDSTASEEILAAIKSAEEDKKIRAILLEVDSFGGEPVAGEEVALALKKATKPTIAYIRTGGASAAYMAASGAQTIFASKYSDVGSIGVTISYLDNIDKNKKEGLSFNQLSAGLYKDMLNPDKQMTDAEKKLVKRDLNIIHDGFIKMVAENRKLDVATVRKMADGSVMLGQMALENKLVDKIGNYDDVIDFVSSTVDFSVAMTKEEVMDEWLKSDDRDIKTTSTAKLNVCWY